MMHLPVPLAPAHDSLAGKDGTGNMVVFVSPLAKPPAGALPARLQPISQHVLSAMLPLGSFVTHLGAVLLPLGIRLGVQWATR